MLFRNREEAGRLLAQALMRFAGTPLVVYALPRGGVVLGAEIAQALRGPLDLLIPRKIGHPKNPEYAICAVSESGQLVCNETERALVDAAWLAQAVARERAEAARRRERYLAGREAITVTGKTAILVDDGIATGLTMRAAIAEVTSRHPARVIVAVPVIPAETAELLREEVDEVVALEIPEIFLGAIGAYYADFAPVSDEEVVRLLGERR